MKRKLGLVLLIGAMLLSLFVGSSIVANANAVILSEDFGAKDLDTFYSAAYKSLKNDPSKPLYIATGGECVIENGAFTLGNSRFTIGALDKEPTTATTTPGGTLDLSKPYKISFKVLAVSGNTAKKLQVYVDNNTTGMANSPLGGASRVLSVPLSDVKAGSTIEIKPEVGTANSFIQLRVESEGSVVIDDLLIESL
ncbi:MAG: hypothetical protein ACM3YE_13310 [Bacteroidota bacterium]